MIALIMCRIIISKVNQIFQRKLNPNMIQSFKQLVSNIKHAYNQRAIKYKEIQSLQFKLSDLYTNVNFQQQAKDQFGNLHPQYAQPVRKGYQDVNDYVQLFANDILNTVREIDLLCIKTCNRSYQNYDRCKLQTNDQIHKKIFVPLVNSSAFLYKVSNQCMLEGKNIDDCSKIVAEHTYFMFKLAAERIKLMTVPLQQKVPEELQPPKIYNLKLNNAID